MKKILLVSILVLSIVATAVCLVACNPDDDGANDFVAPSFEFTRPEGLPDYALTIEWIGKDGNATSFVPNKPTAIVFGGVSEYNVKDGINLSKEVYGNALSSGFELKQTSHLWYRQGWNIGVFHYENFADDKESNVNDKIYNSNKMTYLNVDGEPVTTTPDFNLTEAFISAYLKACTSDGLAKSGGKYVQEVRFIGNGVGANLAISCAEYLDYLYENGAVGVGYLADRIDVLDPYFSNTGVATVIDFYPQTTLGSALSYNSKAIVELADKGTVFTLVESNPEFYDEYDVRYQGVSVIDDKVTFTDTYDSALYLDIKEKVAYLNFRETFSSKLPEAYQSLKRTTLDWFLYTINGSDYGSVSVQGSDTDIRAMLDGYNMPGVTPASSVKYAVSAWTPTIYMRAARGHEYNMKTYDKYDLKTADYTLEKFASESRQISDFTMEDGYAVCGYLYLQEDDTHFINYNRTARLENAKVTINVTLNQEGENSKSELIVVEADKDGFYYCSLGESRVGANVAISAVTPSKNYTYSTSDATSSSNYKHLNKNMITTAGGISTTLSDTANQAFFLYFASCGFIEI